MTPELLEEFEALLLVMEEGTLDDAQLQRLRALLAMHPEARSAYVQWQSMTAALHLEQSAGLDDEPGSSLSEARPRRQLSMGLLSMLATLVLTLVLGLGIGHMLTAAKSINPLLMDAVETQDGSVALLVQALDVGWTSAEHPTVGAPVSPGTLALDQGLLQLDFYSGAQLIVEAPAEIELIGPNEVICRQGRLRAQVPEHARGFTVHAPRFELVDLGTEFGIEVGGDGKAEIQVFDGEVEVYRPDGKRDANGLRRLLGGSGIAWHGAGEGVPITPDPDRFASFDEVMTLSQDDTQKRLAAWRVFNQERASDPRILVHYDFEGKGRRLLDRGALKRHGTIVGSERSQGRFSGKGALEFKRISDRVRIEVPGTFDQMTFMTWIRVDALPGRAQSLILTDGHQVGRPHWQIEPAGRVRLGMRFSEELIRTQGSKSSAHSSPVLLTPPQIGSWHFICSIYDATESEVRHYMNGRLASAKPLQAALPLTIGRAEIGNWAHGSYAAGGPRNVVRNFIGRIDELTVWNVALNSEEILNIYLQSRP